MSVATDLGAFVAQWDLTGDLATYASAIGQMFAEVESYAQDPDNPNPDLWHALLAAYAINLMPNPSFEYDALGAAPANWGPSTFGTGSTFTTFLVQNGWAESGTKSLRVTGNTVASGYLGGVSPQPPAAVAAPVVPGASYTFSFWINLLSSTGVGVYGYVGWYTAAGGYISSVSGGGSTGTPGVQHVSVSGLVAPPGAAYAQPYFFALNLTGGTLAVDFYVDALQFVQAGALPTYFDGDTPGYKWLGTPGDSASQGVPVLPPVGWQPIWDVDTAPHNALPWLAMMVGELIPMGSTDAQARTLIRAVPNQSRGTPQAIASAVQQVLTGTHVIGFRERYTSAGAQDDDALAVFTYVAQTPNVNAVIAALRSTVPADIDVYYQDLTGPTWAGLEAGMGSWTALEAADGPRWLDVEARTPGYVLYTS